MGDTTSYLGHIRKKEEIPMADTVMVAAFRWALLAGFLLLPRAMAQLQRDEHQFWVQTRARSEASGYVSTLHSKHSG